MIDWHKSVVAPCLGVFGEPATFVPKTGAPFAIGVVFDDAYKVVTMSGDGVEVISSYPAIGVALGQFPAAPVQGDQVRIASNGKTYTVREPRPDSHGGAFLILNYARG